MDVNKLAELFAAAEDGRDDTVANQWSVPSASARVIAVGPSGSGKTTAIVDAIARGLVRFSELLLVTSTPGQPKYRWLLHVLDLARSRAQEKENRAADAEERPVREIAPFFHVATSAAELPAPESLDANVQRLILVDDMLGVRELEEPLAALFSRVRHLRKTAVWYLVQKWSRAIPTVVRENATDVLLWPAPALRSNDEVWRDCAPGIELDVWRKLCAAVRAQKNSFLRIALQENRLPLRLTVDWRFVVNFSALA